MSHNTYKVTCLKCKESDNIIINQDSYLILSYERQAETNFLAGRWRADLQWGWECKCGNDNRLSQKEEGQFKQLVQGDPISIEKIAKSLSIPDKQQFRMVTA